MGKILLIVFLLAAFLATLLGLPGTFIVAVAALIYGLLSGFGAFSWWLVGGLFAVAIVAEIADQVLTTWGVRKYQGSSRGMWGAWGGGVLGAIAGGSVASLLGSVLGPVGTLAGFVLGPLVGGLLGGFLGALSLEMTQGKSREEALRAGWGAFVGRTVGTVAKIAICGGMILIVLWRVIPYG